MLFINNIIYRSLTNDHHITITTQCIESSSNILHYIRKFGCFQYLQYIDFDKLSEVCYYTIISHMTHI